MCEHIEKIGNVQSPSGVKEPPQKRRAVIRVESAETLDYVSEPQEMEEFSFFPSAVNEQRWAVHMCDNKCNKEGNKFHQLAVIVVEGGAAHTINPCKQCYNVMRMKRGERKVTASPSKKKWARSDWADAKKEREEGREGACQALQGPAL